MKNVCWAKSQILANQVVSNVNLYFKNSESKIDQFDSEIIQSKINDCNLCSEIMQQTQLKIYIIHLKELISTLDKAKFFDDDLFEKFYAFVFRNHPFADTVAKCCFEDIESNSRSDEKINKENELIDYETTMIETQLKTNLVDETVQEELNDQTFSDNELDDKKVIDASLLTIYSQTETEYKKQETNLENTQEDSGSDGIQEQQSMETFSNPFKISQSKSFLSDSPEFDFFDSDSDDEDLQPIF